MGNKTNPKSMRVGVTKNWDSRWFVSKKSFPAFLQEDWKIRDYVLKMKAAGIEKAEIERLGDKVNVTITAARPGVIIGRGGKGVEKMKIDLEKIIKRHRRENKIETPFSLNINIEEVKIPTLSAAVMAQIIAEDLEKRLPHRRVMKRAIEQINQNKEAKGLKIRLSGRLDGAEISRTEWMDWGKMPLQTLRSDIDYAQSRARCSYGTIGVKVWIYKGEVFGRATDNQENK